MIYDTSNACLGILSGMIQIANMIELGQIRAGLVVGSETGRELVENTIRRLNADTSLTRKDIKSLVASLTIGSGSVAILLCEESLSRTGNRFLAASVLARTEHHQLCQSTGLENFMQTDSEELMKCGASPLATKPSITSCEKPTGNRHDIDKTICHQVGVAHRRLLFESLDLSPDLDFATSGISRETPGLWHYR